MSDSEVSKALRYFNFYAAYSSGYHAAIRNLLGNLERMPKVELVSGCRTARGEIIMAIMQLLLTERQVLDEHIEYCGNITNVWLRVEGEGKARRVIAYKKGA